MNQPIDLRPTVSCCICRTNQVPLGIMGDNGKKKCDICILRQRREKAREVYLQRRHKVLKKKNCTKCGVMIVPVFGKARREICFGCTRLIVKRFYQQRYCLYCEKPVRGKQMYCSRSCSQAMFYLVRVSRKEMDNTLVD